MPFLNVETTTSKLHYFDRIGSTEAEEITTRHGDTPTPANLAHSRRGAILRSFDKAELIDDADKVRMIIDPTNPYTMSLANALGRQMDHVILGAIYGSANSYDSSEAATAVTFATDNSTGVVDEDFTTANSDLTVEKLLEARRLLQTNFVDLRGETPLLLHDGTALAALLNTTKATSSDYNTVKALVNGEIDTFAGFKFVHCELLADARHKTSEGFVRAIAMVPSAMGVVTNGMIETDITKRPDKRNATQIYVKGHIGAVRVWGDRVVIIECYRA